MPAKIGTVRNKVFSASFSPGKNENEKRYKYVKKNQTSYGEDLAKKSEIFH
ncbi:MAG: hypothetical protein NC906_00295 [Candidatus Omnitrophica bacterium]|nr:hypothetical protein [Candidatus Omnitrophota bacterium]MCM8817310.1 hypothetical protein [Candidatus Omnitrophota bacterium]